MRRLARRQIDAGIPFLCACGTTGENPTLTDAEQLETRVTDIYAGRHDKTMFIAGAPSLRYKAIVGALDAAKGAGVERVGIVTESLRQAVGH